MLVLQIILYLLLFTGMVALAVRGGAVNGLFFYPKPVQERAFAIGLADRTAMGKRRKRFMMLFYLVMLGALLFIIGVWNGVRDFKTAYWQALLFLEVMNWYDGIVIDRLWVGHSKFWILPGTEDPLCADMEAGAEEAGIPNLDLGRGSGNRGRVGRFDFLTMVCLICRKRKEAY